MLKSLHFDTLILWHLRKKFLAYVLCRNSNVYNWSCSYFIESCNTVMFPSAFRIVLYFMFYNNWLLEKLAKCKIGLNLPWPSMTYAGLKKTTDSERKKQPQARRHDSLRVCTLRGERSKECRNQRRRDRGRQGRKLPLRSVLWNWADVLEDHAALHWNVGTLLGDYMASHSSTQQPS